MKLVNGANPGTIKLLSSNKTDRNQAVIRRKLERIKRKLRAGARLTASEKEFLRRYAPQLYREAVAIEREREAYEKRLKQCRTKEEAERVKTEKMAEIAASKDEDVDTKIMRMAQTKAAEEIAAPVIRRKPSLAEKEKRQREIARKQRKEREKKERERINKERREKEREEDEYFKAKRRQEEQKQRYWAKEAGIIYKRPVREMDGDNEGEVITAANLERVDEQAARVRGRAVYQAVASQAGQLQGAGRTVPEGAGLFRGTEAGDAQAESAQPMSEETGIFREEQPELLRRT